MSQHRNSQKRYYEENSIYFIVTKTFQNFPYFKEPIFCELFIEDLKICKELKKFKLYGFCLIHDHLNLLIHPNNEFNISKVMKSLKENISRNINVIMGFTQKNNQTKTIDRFHSQFIQRYGKNQIVIPKFKWQKSFYDHIVRNNKDFEYHYNYTVYNFQKHKLSENWKYTSSNYGELIDGITL